MDPAVQRAGRTHRAWLCGLLLVLLWNCLYYQPYVVDDAFISLRYARNLAEGEGLVFNPGERVEGYSNFLWVLLSAALVSAGLPVLTWIKVVGVLAGLATGWATYRLGRLLFAERGRGATMSLLAAGGVCLNTSLAVWTQGGLETALFAALIVSMCYRFELERRGRARVPWSALLFALAWLTRPEAPVYGLYFLARRWSDRAPLDRRDAAWVAALLAVVVPYEAWGLWYFGELFPNTHTAKVGGSFSWLGRMGGNDPEGSVPPALRSQLFAFLFQQGWAFLGLWTLGLLGCASRVRSVPAAAWAPAAGGLIFVLYAWSDWMPRFRFLVPALPAVFLLLAHGLFRLGGLAPLRRVPGVARAAVLVALGLGYAHHQMFAAYHHTRGRETFHFPTAARGPDWVLEVPANLRRRIYPQEGVAALILEHTARRDTVAIGDIGFPSYLSMNPIWDLRGLVTPAAARIDRNDPATVAAAVDDLLARSPALILIPAVHSELRHMRVLEEALRADPRSAAYERTAPEGARTVLYVRRQRSRVPPGRIEKALAAFPEYGPVLERNRERGRGR